MNNSKFYKIGVAISILLIGIIIAFIVIAQKNDDVAKAEDFPSVSSSTNVTEEAEVIEDDFEEIALVENETDNANTANVSGKNENAKNEVANNVNTTSVKNTTSQSSNSTNVSTNESKTETKTADPTFKYPVDGEITMEYAKDKLVYSNTLGEWITHTGIDIKADTTTVVKASADGTVKSIKTDPRYGLTVVIEHSNGFSTVYSNLLTAEFVSEGEKVTSGQTIGTVGNTASFEILDESHLHFEILKDGEQIDPNMYLKK